MIDFYKNLPLYIDPVAFSIGSFAVRWYSLSYIAGFVVVYCVLLWRIKRGEININSELKIQDTVVDFLLVAFVAALVGGRLGYVLFYNSSYYFANPLAIASPYDFQGHYIGLFGMSYHGALLAIIIASYVFLKKKNINFFDWADFVIPAAALGYFFGRIGNFLNGELYGRVTNSPVGMYFAADSNHLRHPSQLYEAFLEGALLVVILWTMRGRKLKRGSLFGVYLVGYGTARIFAEQFRQPDSQLGLLWNYFTMGQVLSSVMVLGGLFLLISKNEK